MEGKTELLNEECPSCDYVLDPIPVDEVKLHAGEAGLQVCPECRSIVPPCNACEYQFSTIDFCAPGKCPYIRPGVEVVNIREFQVIDER